MPPSTSGIADYSALLVPALGRLVDLDIVSAPRRRHRGCDLALYHVGNNAEEHGWIVEALREQPGLVVLHEHVLHHLIAGMTIAAGDDDGYLQAMQRDAGVVGRLLAHGIIDGIVPPVWESRPEDFPLCGEVLDLATGLIVHSDTVEAAVRGRGYKGVVHRIPHPAWPRPELHPDPALAGVDGPVFGAFGHLNSAKRVPQLVEAFDAVAARDPGARLLLVGSPAEDSAIRARLERILQERPDSVIHLPYVPESRLWDLIAACDVCVCLRAPTMGETSGVAIRALVCGRPLIVSDIGWFSELPDEVALRVPVGDGEITALADSMAALAADPARRAARTAAAIDQVAREHAVDHVAELYRRAIVDTAGGQAVRAGVRGEVAAAAAGAGLEPGGQEVRMIAARLGEVGW
jgi:glycosyltransferase involved in cell wall biosynthesis